LLTLATTALTSVKLWDAVCPARLTVTADVELPAVADVLPVKVSVPERLPLTDVYCDVTPVGKPLTVTDGVPAGPVMVTGSWTVAPSCGTTTVELPSEKDRVTGVGETVTFPPPHPIAASANPTATMP
jgi:hypothetical protein